MKEEGVGTGREEGAMHIGCTNVVGGLPNKSNGSAK